MKLRIILFVALTGIFSAAQLSGTQAAGAHGDKEILVSASGISESEQHGTTIYFGPGRGHNLPISQDDSKIDRCREQGLNCSIGISGIVQGIEEGFSFHADIKNAETIPARRHSSLAKILFRVIISPNAP